MTSRAWIATVVAALSLALAACGGDDEDEPRGTTPARATPPPAETTDAEASGGAEQLEYGAEGGATIRATFTPSGESGRGPAVILVHQFGSDRSDWDELVPQLNERGFHTLAYDIRGMGDSEAEDPGDVAAFPLDVQAAVRQLRARDDVDPERIAAIGASVGAGTVFVAAGSGHGLARTVALSPSAGRGLDGDDVEGFAPRGVLFVADESEIGDSRELAEETAEPKRVLQSQADGHGITLLGDQSVSAAIFDWLEPLSAR